MTTPAAPRTGAGDPARTVALLWRHHTAAGTGPRRGPRPALTVDAVVRAGTAVADAQGWEALTMRRLAAELGVGAMTLYHYVPGKDELLDLMLDAAYLAMDRTDTTGRGWRARLVAVAAENRALFGAHPWAAQVTTTRPPLGPGQMTKYEHELRALDGLGLDDLDTDAALAHLLAFVADHARHRLAAAPGDDRDWWDRAGPALAAVLDPADFPTAARIGTAVGEAGGSAADPDRAWAFGLEVVLDGLSTRLGLP